MNAEPVEVLVRVDRALSIKSVVAALDIPRKRFYLMRQKALFPPPDVEMPSLKPGGEARPRWYASTVNAWLEQHRRNARRSTSEER